MTKKKILDQTWTLCLRMWRSVSRKWAKATVKTKKSPYNLGKLKVSWLRKNGFGRETIMSNCFFCEFQNPPGGCGRCPGVLVDPSFNCYNKAYSFRNNPPAFYEELLRLNRIRKGKK